MGIFQGPYLCMMCGEEPKGWREPSGLWMLAPFEVDDGMHDTTKDEAWVYCKPCDCWTAFGPIPDDPAPDSNREEASE